MSATLRPARSTDAGTTGHILWQFQDQTTWMPKLHTGAETVAYCGLMIDWGWVTVAEIDDRVVGFLARDGDEICAMYISPDVKGQGIGHQLLQAAKAQSKRLDLWAFQANSGALRFYRREGFVEVARTDGAHNEENLPDVNLVWPKEAAK